MSTPLYTRDILRLASETALSPRLAHPDATVERRSRLCGSSITVDLVFDGDRIARYGHAVRACAFGQASAALLAHGIVGRTTGELAAVRDALAAWLAGDDAAHPAWPGIETLNAARGHPARHAAILLPFDAAVAGAMLPAA